MIYNNINFGKLIKIDLNTVKCRFMISFNNFIQYKKYLLFYYLEIILKQWTTIAQLRVSLRFNFYFFILWIL